MILTIVVTNFVVVVVVAVAVVAVVVVVVVVVVAVVVVNMLCLLHMQVQDSALDTQGNCDIVVI